jgi:hypothetical protein
MKIIKSQNYRSMFSQDPGMPDGLGEQDISGEDNYREDEKMVTENYPINILGEIREVNVTYSPLEVEKVTINGIDGIEIDEFLELNPRMLSLMNGLEDTIVESIRTEIHSRGY